MLDIVTKPYFLVPFCALAYAAAAVGMKWASDGHGMGAALLIVSCLGIAVALEIILLQRVSLGLTYVAILIAETVLILGVATLMGEGLSARQMAGAALVLAGAAVISV